MSLDCYPLGRRRTIDFAEQPLGLDVAYNDDLLISTSDQCKTISIYELATSHNDDQATLYRKISLGQGIVIEQIVYCRTGDYLACVGDKNGTVSVYVIIGWRETTKDGPNIIELNLNNVAGKTKSSKPNQLNSIDCCQRTGNLAVSNGELILIYRQQSGKQEFEHIISVMLNIFALKICLIENYLAITAADHVQVLKLEVLALQIQSEGLDGCITWNLNTKKLVKLPTLMHNTSSDLSSYHICHPLELLGPTSESIACRVSATVYLPDFSQNQLEAVVMLCKQFDFDWDPVKSTHLQAVYLSSLEDHRRISKSASAMMDYDSGCDQASGCDREATLLKSAEYELLASVTCFVCTLANCYVYSLHGKKVTCSQTITHPDLCLDLRPDLLNVYLLTPLGLQICSTGICDSTFGYDWSSSADLNLSFIATNRIRVLTSRQFVILVACSVSGRCELEYFEKPNLSGLLDRIVDTVNHCNSISIRANMLTYLHASSHLALIDGRNSVEEKSATCNIKMRGQEERRKRSMIVWNLKSITIMLCKQLLQKRQTNEITNNRIDKAIKHLLDISMCDLAELMRRHMQSESEKQSNYKVEISNSIESESPKSNAADARSHRASQGRRQLERFRLKRSALVDNDAGSAAADQTKSISNTTIDYYDKDADAAADSDAGADADADASEGYDLLLMSSDGDDDIDDADKPLDTDYELIRIYLKHSKFSQWLLDYLVSISRDENMTMRVIDYMFEHNPRLLIKCAQRYPLLKDGDENEPDADDNDDDDDDAHGDADHQAVPSPAGSSVSDCLNGAAISTAGFGRTAFCMSILVEKLEQLVELDSTGINRATVLFTLAALYNALADRQKCLAVLNRIKPLNHLAITMCSNYELSLSIVGVVSENYPDVYALYLRQLAKRDRFAGTICTNRREITSDSDSILLV